MNNANSSSRSIIHSAWKEIFALAEINPDISFMDLGGSSLTANLLVSTLSKRLERTIPVIKIFEFPTLRQFTNYLLGNSEEVIEEGPQVSHKNNAANAVTDHHDIAIVGMACRFPGANNKNEFWANLVEGKNSIKILSDEELSPEISEELKADPRFVKACGKIDQSYSMDADFFDIGPMEAKLIDPQHRVLLELAYQALEDAGHGAGSIQGRTAVYAGVEDNTYYKTEIAPFPEAEKRAGHFSVMTGNEKDFVAMRIAHKLNLKGPAISVHTACSTSLVAVIMACKSLRYGECDMAIAGGAALHFPTNDGYYYQEGGVFSPDGLCRPFDKNAQGTIFTDGAGIVVLKRLRDAVRDRNTILAVIKGGAINNDGGDKLSFSAPSIAGQTNCISDALADAQVDAESIQYIESHGTATPIGDPIEVEALRQAFRKTTKKLQFCGLGSVKSNIGHTTAAAGIASLIKTVLSLKNQKIPATIHYKSPNPELNIENSPFYIVNKLTNWLPGISPRRAGISSFGIGGTNSHLILEEASSIVPKEEATHIVRPFEILPISAKNNSQRDLLIAGIEKLRENPRDIAFSLQNGRSSFKARAVIIRSALGEDIILKNEKPIEESRLIFMFPGQGSQYIQMGKSLYEHFPEFRESFQECSAILSDAMGFDFKEFIFDPKNSETLENTKYTQPALFAIEVSLGKMLLGWGIIPEIMIGHSIGEFAAAHLAGVFSLEDGLKLITARGNLMSSLPPGKMLSVRGSIERAKTIAGADIDIASINSPIHCVLAGRDEKIVEIKELLEKDGLPCRMLHTSHAFHSRMMQAVVEPFLTIAREIKYAAPKLRILSTVTKNELTAHEAMDPKYWANHLCATVEFSEAIFKTIAEQSGNIFLEIGPRSTLSTLALQHLKGEKGTAISTMGDNSEESVELNALATGLAKLWIYGQNISWNQIWSGGSRIPLMDYPFERKEFRFSENRTTKLIMKAQEELSIPQEAAVLKAPEISSEQLLSKELQNLFAEYSGMSIDSRSFLELGLDSLVLMQIGVELGRKYNISISLRDLMNTFNTIPLLCKRIQDLASIDRLPKPTKKQIAEIAVHNIPHKILPVKEPISPMQGDTAQIIFQQLNQMKEVLELQMQLLSSQNKIKPSSTSNAGKLIRANHIVPPAPGAFRSKTPDGKEAWFRFDAKTQKYEYLQ